MRRMAWVVGGLGWLGLVACGDSAGPRPIGASCSQGGECASGLCGDGTCLDPEADTDGDGLINRIEAALGTSMTEANSDGDAGDDLAEVGTLDAPADRDGDGKIDAVESAAADADSDCIADEDDPRDGYSDPPSDAFPEACGDGTAHCDVNPLGGTCADGLGAMVGECFRPEGGCTVSIPSANEASGSVTWSNGASMTYRQSGKLVTGTLVGPTGTVCATMTVRDPDGPSPSTTLRVTSTGLQYLFLDEDDGGTTIVCPSGGRVTLSQESSAAFGQCSGDTSAAGCSYDLPGSCTSDAQCEGTGICCPVPIGTSEEWMCLPVETCPDLGAS